MNSVEGDLEEIQIWKKNSAFMYNMLNFHTLYWPSLTCQWLPGKERRDEADVFQLLLGTHANNEENKVFVVNVSITENDIERRDNADSSVDCQYGRKAKIETVRSMSHNGDVNRARYMPQNQSIIATRSSEDDSYIYDNNGVLCTLRGHTDEGYGVSWSPHKEGHLLTAGFDKKICLWDISHIGDGNVVTPTSVMQSHSDKAEDVMWHPRLESVFASVSDDKSLHIWDTRSSRSAPSQRVQAHSDEVNCVSWHPITEYLLLTGGCDECVHLWDSRSLVTPLHTFEDDGPVYRLCWSPLHETMFVSSGLHRRIHVWDVDAIGDDVLSLVEEGGPPELTMVHSGHLESISDLDWHPDLPWTMASVSEDNVLNIWQMVINICLDLTIIISI